MDTTSVPVIGGPSPRVRLAQLARDTALAIPGVADLDAGPTGTFGTVGGGRHVGGVTCATAPEGGFDLAMRIVSRLVPMMPLGDRVRAAIQRAAMAEEGLGVASVSILIADVVDGDA